MPLMGRGLSVSRQVDVGLKRLDLLKNIYLLGQRGQEVFGQDQEDIRVIEHASRST
jgi:hypothetical protein